MTYNLRHYQIWPTLRWHVLEKENHEHIKGHNSQIWPTLQQYILDNKTMKQQSLCTATGGLNKQLTGICYLK